MRTVLVGAVETSRVALESMIESGRPPAALLTLPCEKAARHSDYVDLHPLAARAGITVVDAPNVNAPEALTALAALEPDHVLVIGWSQICRREFLDVPSRGCIGYHPAPLPLNRGRAVIPWTILQRATETAGTLFWLDEGMDSGDVLVQRHFPVSADETARTLYDKHTTVLRELVREALDALVSGDPPRIPQDHSRATYCARRTADDGHIDWSRSADEIWALVRAAGDPYPGAFTFARGRRLVVRQAIVVQSDRYLGLVGQVQRLDEAGALVRCGDGEFLLMTSVQHDGEAPVAPAAALKTHEKLGIDWLALHSTLARNGNGAR